MKCSFPELQFDDSASGWKHLEGYQLILTLFTVRTFREAEQVHNGLLLCPPNCLSHLLN